MFTANHAGMFSAPSNSALDEEEARAAAEEAKEEEKGPKYRYAVLGALGVALLIYVLARGISAAPLQQQQQHPAVVVRGHVLASQSGAKPKPASARSVPKPKPPKAPKKKKATKPSDKDREAARLNDVKTQEIRAAQEDPTSMFDMSNAR